jgi:hypothetical protein
MLQYVWFVWSAQSLIFKVCVEVGKETSIHRVRVLLCEIGTDLIVYTKNWRGMYIIKYKVPLSYLFPTVNNESFQRYYENCSSILQIWTVTTAIKAMRVYCVRVVWNITRIILITCTNFNFLIGVLFHL